MSLFKILHILLYRLTLEWEIACMYACKHVFPSGSNEINNSDSGLSWSLGLMRVSLLQGLNRAIHLTGCFCVHWPSVSSRFFYVSGSCVAVSLIRYCSGCKYTITPPPRVIFCSLTWCIDLVWAVLKIQQVYYSKCLDSQSAVALPSGETF